MMWYRFAAGASLGLPLSIALVGLFARTWPGGWAGAIIPCVLIFFPLWTLIMILSARVQRLATAWGSLAALNGVAYLVLWSTRHALV